MKLAHYDGTRYDFAIEKLNGLSLSKDQVVFDVGAGKSEIRKAQKNIDYHFHEFDLSPKAPTVTKWNVEEVFSKKERADVVLLMDVIEHLWNPGIGLKNISDVINEEGILILSVPNPAWSKARVHFLFKNQISCFTKNDLEANHHVFTSWPHIIYRLLNKNGFEVLEHVTLESKLEFPNRLFSPSIVFRVLAYFLAKIIEIFDPMSKGINYVLVAKKS